MKPGSCAAVGACGIRGFNGQPGVHVDPSTQSLHVHTLPSDTVDHTIADAPAASRGGRSTSPEMRGVPELPELPEVLGRCHHCGEPITLRDDPPVVIHSDGRPDIMFLPQHFICDCGRNHKLKLSTCTVSVDKTTNAMSVYSGEADCHRPANSEEYIIQIRLERKR
jgi:hypothetical protein